MVGVFGFGLQRRERLKVGEGSQFAVLALLSRYDEHMPKFMKGTSGNPNGRPKTTPDVRAALRALTPAAVERLGQLVADPDPKIALKACLAVIDATLPRGAPLPHAVPEGEAEQVAVVEGALFDGAADGDTRAALEWLRARDPSRWPRQATGAADDDRYVDIVDWTPAIIPAER